MTADRRYLIPAAFRSAADAKIRATARQVGRPFGELRVDVPDPVAERVLGRLVGFPEFLVVVEAGEFQTPLAPGVRFHDVFGVPVAGPGDDNPAINGAGGPVTPANPERAGPADVASYP